MVAWLPIGRVEYVPWPQESAAAIPSRYRQEVRPPPAPPQSAQILALVFNRPVALISPSAHLLLLFGHPSPLHLKKLSFLSRVLYSIHSFLQHRLRTTYFCPPI